MKNIQPFLDLFSFISKRSDICRHLAISFFPIFFVLFRNDLVFNEELLIVLCFMSAIYFLYVQLGDSIEESLNDRSEKIKKDLFSFEVIKLDHLNNLYKTTSKVLEIKNQIEDLRSFSLQSIKTLDENQRQAFVGLISKNMIKKLQILTNVNKSAFSNFLVESFNVKFSRKLRATITQSNTKFFGTPVVKKVEEKKRRPATDTKKKPVSKSKKK